MNGSRLIRKLTALALEEDLSYGDITARLTVPENHRSRATVYAKESLVFCGIEIFEPLIQEGKWNFSMEVSVTDGVQVAPGDELVSFTGATRDLLAMERTLLNFLQRLSGVATVTQRFCAARPGLIVLDTRKTMPGWRVLDKYAVRIGGGRNHRFCLGDMILVKNNHIDAFAKGLRATLERVQADKPIYMPWEVEVRDLEELEIALSFAPSIIMLDNFSDERVAEAMALVRTVDNPPMIEVSGGVGIDRLERLAELGIDAVSVGALTTKANNVDIAMRIEAESE
jgi:nicotinate-nucleotide pyrophosphorylase (carboxylating)